MRHRHRALSSSAQICWCSCWRCALLHLGRARGGKSTPSRCALVHARQRDIAPEMRRYAHNAPTQYLTAELLGARQPLAAVSATVATATACAAFRTFGRASPVAVSSSSHALGRAWLPDAAAISCDRHASVPAARRNNHGTLLDGARVHGGRTCSQMVSGCAVSSCPRHASTCRAMMALAA